MKLLIIGGTVFVGRHLVISALERGHTVTLFNRGQHNPDLFPEVEKLRGNRDGDLAALRGRSWDAVIDTCGYFPRVVRQSAELLAGSVDHYTFISSISAYAGSSVPGADESAPLARLEDESVEEITGETYGGLKVLCEQVVEELYPGQALIVRPGYIVGPDDPTDRFTYWPVRAARGGEMLAPGRPQNAIQFIDVRDLAQWTIREVEKRTAGAFNATGPDHPLQVGRFLETCRDVSGSEVHFTWVPDAFLEEQNAKYGSELPLVVPDTDEYRGFHAVDVGKAVRAGLTFRPLEETVRDTLAWEDSRPPHDWRAGLTPEREQELLAAWHARATAGVAPSA